MEGSSLMAGSKAAGILGLFCLSIIFFGLGWLIGWSIGKRFGCPRRGIIAGVAGSLLGAWLGYYINDINYVPLPPPGTDAWHQHIDQYGHNPRATSHDWREPAYMLVGAVAGGSVFPLVVVMFRGK